MQKTLSGFFQKSPTKTSAPPASSVDELPSKRAKIEEVEEGKPSVPTEAPILAAASTENIQKNKIDALVKRMSAQLKEPSWKELLASEFAKPYFRKLVTFLDQERSAGKVIFPPEPQTFTALNLCPINEIKVVILGQDPYHGPNQAMGMAFSVNRGVAVPPSLQNMYKELNDDIPGFKIPGHGNLEGWARQGVLLLNTVLSVVKATAGSHQGQGWEQFTDHIIRLINEKSNNVVFILWGVPAQKKAPLINTKKHFILKGPHPSPLSAHKGFFGCKHFSQANKLLEQAGRAPINWSQLDVVPPKDPSVSQPQPQPQPQPTSDPAATDSANSNAGTAEAKQPESDYAT